MNTACSSNAPFAPLGRASPTSEKWTLHVVAKGKDLADLGKSVKILNAETEADLADGEVIRSSEVVLVNEDPRATRRLSEGGRISPGWICRGAAAQYWPAPDEGDRGHVSVSESRQVHGQKRW